MKNPLPFFILASVIILLDLYVFQALKTVTNFANDKNRSLIHTIFWLFTFLTIFCLIAYPFLPFLQTNKIFRNYIFAILIGLFIAKMIASLFFLIDDLRRLVLWLIEKISPASSAENLEITSNITRSVFLSWLGLGIGSTLFGTLLYGFSNKYKYQVKRIKLSFDNLPAAFKGFKIVHISDIHTGSFNDKIAVQHGVDLIKEQAADLILFTGDLVNDKHTELVDYVSIFSQLKAPHGVFSTLGNHDYGDYVKWETPVAKATNLQNLKDLQATMGWRLLMNEHVVIEKNEQKFALIGIENWGAKGRFPKYGKLKEAHENTKDFKFKILMSHDPSHWDAEVKPLYNDIDLMLSGHTHGMQFGLETPFFKFSPVQWMYNQWAGLYEDGKQKLYVNRGFGFIGYPGRVGILPEITVIELG